MATEGSAIQQLAPEKTVKASRMFDFDMSSLTELIVCSGYENRIVKNGETFCSYVLIDWEPPGFTWSPFNAAMTPLCAGGRVISPEELDSGLACAMGIDENGLPEERKETDESDLDSRDTEENPWTTHSPRTLSEPICPTMQPAPINRIFEKYNPADPEDNKYTGPLSPRDFRDSLVITRARLLQEVRDICRANNSSASEDGLVLRLNKCRCPLEIGHWIQEHKYCEGDPYDIYRMSHIESGDHRILIVHYEAESG